MTEQLESPAPKRGRPRKPAQDAKPKEPVFLMRRRGRTVEAPKGDIQNMLANGWERVG